MLRDKELSYILIVAMLILGIDVGYADNRPYLCELGLQGGIGYYAGDATPHIFNNVRECYGAHFRYKFDPHWALQVKGLHHRITGPIPEQYRNRKTGDMWLTPMINLDVMAEFNFFRLGMSTYNPKIKPFSPYIFLGIGMSIYDQKYSSVAAYIPLGIGFKWMFAPQWSLNLAWQHNIYIADDLEQMDCFNNTYNLNGSNIMNFDITGQLTLGIVFAFAKGKKVCRHCDQ